jgi:hypothetical protein
LPKARWYSAAARFYARTAACAGIVRTRLRRINIQAARLRVKPTSVCGGADIAKVPLITAR